MIRSPDVVGGLWLVRSHSSCLFWHSLLVDFCLCASTRLVFFTLVSCCWWTLACALILVLSFLTLVRRCWWTLSCALPLVLSFFRLVFFTLVNQLEENKTLSYTTWIKQDIFIHNLKKTRHCHIQLEEISHCWWTLTCALPLVLSFWHWSVTFGGHWLVRSHRSCLFDIGQSLLVDFDLCAPTGLVFLTLVSHFWWTLTCALPLVLSFWHWSVTFGGHWLVRSHWSCLFDIGQSLLVDFDLCAPTRLVFLTLVSHFWWTLTCALPLVLSFWHWSVTVGGLWLARFHSSCLFDIGQSLLVDIDLCAPTRLVFLTLVSHCWWTLTCALPLVLSFWHWSATVGGIWLARSHSSCLFDIGQPLLVEFDLRASTRLVFLTLVSHCWWTLTCALPLVLSFFFTLVSYYWWTLTCALPLVLSFWHWSVSVGGLWLVRSHSSCLLWHWSPIIGELWLVRSHSSCLFDIGQSR